MSEPNENSGYYDEDSLQLAQPIKDRYELKLSKGRLVKGSDIWVYAWDAVQDCRGEACPAANLCTYEWKGRCSVEMSYIRAITDVVYANYSDELTEPLLWRIGTHLVPLYKMLCKLKIEELGTRGVTRVDDKGRVMVNPVFKEIRETLKAINNEWRALGLTSIGDAGITDEEFVGDGGHSGRTGRGRRKV